jgi:hypothetical protein
MKKILITILALALLIGFSAGAMLDIKKTFIGEDMIPNEDNGAPWIGDDAKLFFGTGQDGYLSYDPTNDKINVNGTDAYFDQDVSINGSIATNGTTISNGLIDEDLRINGTHTFTTGTGAVKHGGTLTGDAIVSNGTITSSGNILPTEIVITVPITKAEIVAGEINKTVFTANESWKITLIEERHTAAEATATTATIGVMKCTTTQAPSAGVLTTAAVMDLKSTALTTVTPALSSTASDYTLADGNSLAIWYKNTGAAIGEFRSGCITLHLKRV